MKQSFLQRVFLLTTLLILSYFQLFKNLSTPAIYIFDEAIYANNALEVTKNNRFIALTNNDTICMYNTKPPLVIWTQSVAMRIIGMNELAVRLPSAISAFLIVTFLYLFSIYVLKSHLAGFIAGVCLLSSSGYISLHVARTGDMDAMLTLWITFYTLLAFYYLLREDIKLKQVIYWIGLGVALAFLSKSVAGLIPLAGLSLCFLVSGRFREVVSSKHLYIAIFFALIVCAGYYILREIEGPGYLRYVYYSEYKRFNTVVMSWHHHPFSFYFENLLHERFTPFMYLLPFSLLLGILSPNKTIRRLTVFSVIFFLSYLLIISSSKIKLTWYDAPVYPFMCLLIGILFQCVYAYLKKWLPSMQIPGTVIVAFAALLFYSPYSQVYSAKRNYLPVNNFEKEGYCFRELMNNGRLPANFKILMQGDYPSDYDVANFYRKAYKIEQGINAVIVPYLSQIELYDTVLVCQQQKIDSLRTMFIIQEEESCLECKLVRLKERLQ